MMIIIFVMSRKIMTFKIMYNSISIPVFPNILIFSYILTLRHCFINEVVFNTCLEQQPIWLKQNMYLSYVISVITFVIISCVTARLLHFRKTIYSTIHLWTQLCISVLLLQNVCMLSLSFLPMLSIMSS